jgi:hypothetical protein
MVQFVTSDEVSPSDKTLAAVLVTVKIIIGTSMLESL